MSPNAVASKVAYAGLWSYLKSIDHAIARTLDAKIAANLTDLDKERLSALIELLRQGLDSGTKDPQPSLSLSLHTSTDGPEYCSAIDLSQREDLMDVFKPLANGRPDTKPEEILSEIIAAIDAYLRVQQSNYLRVVPRQELEVVRVILHSVIIDAETAVQYESQF